MRKTGLLAAIAVTTAVIAACASAGNGGGSSPTPTATTPPPTPTPPQITARVPADGASGVALNAAVSVTFDRDMNAATLTTATFFARDAGGAIAATVGYDVPSMTATLSPSAQLPPATLITLTLTSAVTDATGLPLPTQSWSFTSGAVPDTVPPTFAGIVSATNSSDGTAVLSWAAASDDHTPVGSIVYKAYASTNLAAVVAQVTGVTSVSSPPLPAGSYAWTVRAFDAAGNHDTNTATASAAITVPAVAFASQVQPIFSASCAVVLCHDAATQAQGLNLATGAAYAAVVGRPSTEKATLKLVSPYDAAHSYLYLKVTGAAGITGVRMPKGGLPLSASQLALIREWVLDGAPND